MKRVLAFYNHQPHTAKALYGNADYHVLSNWAIAKFTLDNKVYMASEQRMMEQKALLFGDTEAAKKIMSYTYHPTPQNEEEWRRWGNTMHTVKHIGRNVKFRQHVWTNEREKVMYEANLAKFSQNLDMKKILLDTGDLILAEAALHDRVWGAGLAHSDPKIQEQDQWIGLNLLGKALMRVREKLRQSEL